MWWQVIIAFVTLVCAIEAIRAKRLLVSAMWLAGTSALVALLLYILGAPEIAVIELSVGAGLVTVLFVFAINLTGETAPSFKSLIPKPLAWVVITVTVGTLIWLNLPMFWASLPDVQGPTFQAAFWENRQMDGWLQIVLIFAGALGLLGLLADEKPHQSDEEVRA